MNKLVWIGLLLLPVLISCIGETSYYSETGTLNIPWGPKEGDRNPPVDMEEGAVLSG